MLRHVDFGAHRLAVLGHMVFWRGVQHVEVVYGRDNPFLQAAAAQGYGQIQHGTACGARDGQDIRRFHELPALLRPLLHEPPLAVQE